MIETAIASFASKLIAALIALVFVRLALKAFDSKMEFNFKEWINAADTHSVAIYFSGRFIGACLLFGFIFA